MRIEYDKEVDAAYIYLVEDIGDGSVKKNDNIILDLDKDGKLLGIEVLHASRTLNKKSLIEAKSI